MDDSMDSTRNPDLDDEVEGLDCFAIEGVVIDSADDTAALVDTSPALPAVQTVSPRALPVVRTAAQDAWQQWSHRGPWVRRFVVACTVLALGGLTLMLIEPADRPPSIAADKPAPSPVVTPRAQPAPPIARPAAEPAVARTVEPSRATAPTATARTIAPVVPAPARLSSVPPEIPSTAPAAASEAGARLVLPEPAPAPAVIVATPEVVRAEPAPDAPLPAAAALSAIVAPTDRSSIERVLQAYRDAYDRLDAPSAAVIWPRVDTRALNRAFSTLAQQDVSFERCDLDITGGKANAKCTGEIRYVRRVGDQVPRTRKLSWLFALERVSDRWQIAQVTAD
jgi:hypothetical protein